MISHEPSSLKLYAATLQYKQKRSYNNAAEETNKGVVSGLFTWINKSNLSLNFFLTGP